MLVLICLCPPCVMSPVLSQMIYLKIIYFSGKIQSTTSQILHCFVWFSVVHATKVAERQVEYGWVQSLFGA